MEDRARAMWLRSVPLGHRRFPFCCAHSVSGPPDEHPSSAHLQFQSGMSLQSRLTKRIRQLPTVLNCTESRQVALRMLTSKTSTHTGQYNTRHACFLSKISPYGFKRWENLIAETLGCFHLAEKTNTSPNCVVLRSCVNPTVFCRLFWQLPSVQQVWAATLETQAEI